MLAGITLRETPANVAGTDSMVFTADDAAATYKTKCSACHGADASKKFDVTKADEHHVNAILKGQKGEKPPFMPEYGSKGITEEAAKALVAHMRSLRPATN